MASARIKSRGPNSDGTLSISIVIIHNRRQFPKTLFRVPVEYWNDRRSEVRSTYEDNIRLNEIITKELSAAKGYILDRMAKIIPVNPRTYFKGDEPGDDNIVSYLESKVKSCRNFRTAIKFNTCINRINEAGMNTSIRLIDEDWIRKFDDYLYKKKNNQNTRTKYLKAIGQMVAKARKKGIVNFNPFDEYPLASTPGTKAKLSMEEFRKIQTTELDPDLDLIRKFFVFELLARGMRAFDILTLKWNSISDGRLRYQAQKSPSGKEGKKYDMELTPQMEACLEGLDRSTEFVFPFVKHLYGRDMKQDYKIVDSALTMVNEKLKLLATACSINKKLTTHVARHTFAHLMDEAGAGLGMIQNLLGHSDITVTKVYVESLRQSDEMDKAVGKVF